GAMVSDVIATSRAHLANSNAKSVEEIRHLGHSVIRFSNPMWADLQEIRSFLFKNMYRAPSVMAKREEVTKVVHDLFPALLAQPELLPARWQGAVAQAEGDATALARLTADYIAGMTDRFALQEHARLIGAH
ncbi:MAG: deoxyguanosinetriphosphate triphosphohydrolase, partial [Pseudomonadota bacterium]